MNHATLLSFATIVATAVAAAVGVRLRKAAGWSDQAPFFWAALTAALYSLLNLPSTWGPWFSDEAVVLATRLQIAVAALHAAAWVRYTELQLGGPRLPQRLMERALVAVAVLFALPGVAFTDRVSVVEVAWAEAHYRLVAQTPFGELLVDGILVAFVVIAGRHAVAWFEGRRPSGPLALAFAVILVAAANDALASIGAISNPFLVELGLFAPLGVAAWGLGTRFLKETHQLQVLRDCLEGLVEQRTHDLEEALDRLRNVERLATFGQVAAGVAHEVNNPAAAVTSNLEYLLEAHRSGRVPQDCDACLEDALQGMRRISGIVRQLHEAGRAAVRSLAPAAVAVAPVATAAARTARAEGPHVRVELGVPDALHALCEQNVLLQVLTSLLTNAVQAVPGDRSDGRVLVTATRAGDRIRIAVEDNGVGMAEPVLRRAFDPFYSTRGAGRGAGLGLAISRGLVTSAGGELSLESRPGVGTRAVVEVPAAAAEGEPAEQPPARAAASA